MRPCWIARAAALADQSGGDADAKARLLAQADAEIEDLKAQVSAEREAVGEVGRQQQQQQLEYAQAIERERREAERLGAEAVAHKAHATSLQELQARCARTTSHCLRDNDPDRLYRRPPMLDMLDTNSVASLPPGAHGLWQVIPPVLPPCLRAPLRKAPAQTVECGVSRD